MQINLTEMTQLAPIFRELFKGFHISRRDPELYSQLSNQQDAYRALFRSLGYELVCDTRGFYYFVPEQVGAQVNKTAQRLALFTFILVEHLADQGRDPLAVLDGGSIGRDELPPLLEKYRDLFLQAEVTTQEELEEKVMRRLTQLGFAAEDNGVYRFLPPIHRFLDVCLSVQQDRDLAANLHASEMQFSAPVLMEEDDEPVVILESYTADADEEIVAISEPVEAAAVEAAADAAIEDESEEDALARAIAEEQADMEAQA
ncbi:MULTISPECIES: Mks condensin complex protein MksE [Pseudomonadaceae]|uniref:Chromosome partitioning protein n=1 Tax=Pseudomonas denitrificans TaxID=43306 RepID=A0A9X7N2M0_PSEDE|nr:MULTISPECIES: Mks condensin complex protein MksE [Pseudomonadaceae]MBD9630146.1 chromosome partitioning protein [Pseudomonas sp. PDM19]QEY73586.1 chromosome partitioning protein [Pseudomonas denitrificans (nom. rej.)]